MASTVLRTSSGKLDSEDLKALLELERRLKGGSRKVLIYLHGGLVSQKDAEAMAARLAIKEGLGAPDDWEQVYVIWRTGVMETLRANWVDVFENDRLYRALFKRLMSFVSDKLGGLIPQGRGGVATKSMTLDEVEAALVSQSDAPFEALEESPSPAGVPTSRAASLNNVTDDDIELELRTQIELDDDIQDICLEIDTHLARRTNDVARGTFTADATQGARTFSNVNGGIQDEWQATDPGSGRARALLTGTLFSVAKHGVKIAIRVISRIRRGRDHGVHATIAEEIVREFYGDLLGSIIWGMMVKDAKDHFTSGSLGMRLISALSNVEDLKLLLVGHSAGSIWATEFLSARNGPAAVAPADVILLAPAVRMRRFAELLEAAPNSIGRFRMFVMSDELERADVLLGKGYGFIYPSSLLYLVSGLFEDEGDDGAYDAALLGMDRFVGDTPPNLSDPEEVAALRRVRDFLAAEPSRIVRSESNLGAGLNSRSHSHGGFDDDPDTLASVTTYFA